jgi:hypothetical protein
MGSVSRNIGKLGLIWLFKKGKKYRELGGLIWLFHPKWGVFPEI